MAGPWAEYTLMPLSSRYGVELNEPAEELKRESTKRCVLSDAKATPNGSSRPVTKRVSTCVSIGAGATAVEQATSFPVAAVGAPVVVVPLARVEEGEAISVSATARTVAMAARTVPSVCTPTVHHKPLRHNHRTEPLPRVSEKM